MNKSDDKNDLWEISAVSFLTAVSVLFIIRTINQSDRKDFIKSVNQWSMSFDLRLWIRCMWFTVLKTLKMSSNNTEIIWASEIHAVQIYSVSSSSAVSVDQFSLLLIWVSESNWWDSVILCRCCAVIIFIILSNVLSSAIDLQISDSV